MARMYPTELSKAILANKALRGEIKAYNVFKKFPEGFDIFYERCVKSGEFIEAAERPFDFVILHEKLGLLCVEVKGGKVKLADDMGFRHYWPTKKKWVEIDPINQVKKAWFKLLKTCKSDGVNYWIPDICCIVFPDTLRQRLTSKTATIPIGIFCADDLASLHVSIPKFMAEKMRGSKWDRDSYIDMRRRFAARMAAATAIAIKNESSIVVLDKEKKSLKIRPKNYSVLKTEV